MGGGERATVGCICMYEKVVWGIVFLPHVNEEVCSARSTDQEQHT